MRLGPNLHPESKTEDTEWELQGAGTMFETKGKK